MQVQIKAAEVKDLEQILNLFRECVLTVCRADYSEAQLMAWASASSNTERWIRKIRNQFFIVALNKETIVGFASLEGSDKIDLFYVHKDFQRLGVADELFSALLQRAEKNGAKELRSDVSKTAKGFFERKGFNVIVSQSVERGGVTLDNFQMIKVLD
jgi:putative acetyltransferase